MPYSAQAYLPSLAFNALDLPKIIAVAKIAGIDRARVESSTHKITAEYPAYSVRVTCSVEMAEALIEAFRLLAGKAGEQQDEALVIACAKSVKSLDDAIHEARGSSIGDSVPKG